MIHATAIVADSAVIDDSAEIGPYSVIGDNVVIGAGTRIASHVVVNGPTTIGQDNHIFQFASIGEAPQDKKFAGEQTTLTIGDRNTIRECCTFSRGTTATGETVVGDDCLFMAYVHIAHDCIIGSNVIMANNTTLAGHVSIGDWVITAGFSGVHQFCKVGAHAFMGMYAGTNRDVPAYVMARGIPAVPRGINSEGLKRRGFTPEQIRNIKDAYRLIYRKGMKLVDAVEEIASRAETQEELVPLLDSLRSSERGVIR